MTPLTPFRVEIPDAQLDDLRDRLARTRWPEPETVDDWSQGIPLAYVQELCGYWARRLRLARAASAAQRASRSSAPRSTALGIHFLHAARPQPDALPLVITHGWPGSVVEFLDVIGPLTDPAAHGGDAGRRLPRRRARRCPATGSATSRRATGWGVERIADAWARADGRASATTATAPRAATGARWSRPRIGRQRPRARRRHPPQHAARRAPAPRPRATSPTDGAGGARRAGPTTASGGRATRTSSRPARRRSATASTTRPPGSAAWIVEKFCAWTDCDGHPENAVHPRQLLDNVMLYWLPGTGASSARLYWESFRSAATSAGDRRADGRARSSRRRSSACRGAGPRRRFTDLRYWNELDARRPLRRLRAARAVRRRGADLLSDRSLKRMCRAAT